MSALLEIELTLYGQQVQNLSVPIGSTVLWVLHLQDPITREPVDLTGGNVTMSLCELDVKGNPTQPPIFSRQGDIQGDPTEGNVDVPWADGDTAPTGDALRPGSYGIDVWTTGPTGDRHQSMATVIIELLPVSTLPASPITPLPSQLPLAQGPPGDDGPPGPPGDPTAPVTVTGSAAIDAHALIKVSGAATYATLETTDDVALMVGVAVTACAGASQSFTAQLIGGTVTTMLSDGSAIISPGASVCPSDTVSGRIKPGTVNSVGVNVGASVPATLNAQVSVL